jgi:dienelactone hydrolase
MTTEHSFTVSGVPAVLWRPVGAAAPLVLLGHGGSGNKRSDRNVALAQWFVEVAGLAALAIDGPFHGDRADGDYQAHIAAEGAVNVVARMTGDWCAAIDAVADQGLAATDALGYIGLSMGTRYGLPLAAALGRTMRAVVVGKFGLETDVMPPALDTSDELREAAAGVRAKTLFHVQWDDEIFPRAGQFELFELLASEDKRLLAFPGGHSETHADAIVVWREFVAAELS